MRQSGHEPVSGSGTAGDGAAAAVEEARGDAVFGGGLAEGLLGAVEGPTGGEDAAVFVRVRVTEHDLLAGCVAAFDDGVVEEGIEDGRGVIQVVHGFEKRDDFERAHEAVIGRCGETGFAGEEEDAEEVGELAGHRDDE